MPPKKRQRLEVQREPEEYVSCENQEFQHLICFICEGVYSDPVQCQEDHYFCRSCVKDWLHDNKTCPVDLKPLEVNQLKPAPRILRNIIDDLHVKCRYHIFGCPVTVNAQSSLSVSGHTSSCNYRWWSLVDHDYNLIHPTSKEAKNLERGDGGSKLVKNEDIIIIH